MEIATNSARARDKRPAARRERAAGARVDLGMLPKLLGYNLRRAHQTSWRTYVSFIGENKIRPGLFSLLILTRSNPGIAQIELGTHLGVDKASIVALLDRLERAGLIERRRCTRDRRRQGIFLTEAGSAELEALMGQVRQLERHMASRFNKLELEQFLGFLQRMYG
jgi:DNA-binding MarR family transcriptional regulator